MNREIFSRIVQTLFGSVLFELSFLKDFRNFIYKSLFHSGSNLKIGFGTIFYRESVIKGNINIGKNVSIDSEVLIDYSGGLKIGNNVSISHRSAIFTHEHKFKKGAHSLDKEPIRKPLTIKDSVWIGFQTIILPSVETIGKGSVIGAGSVVTKDIPNHTVVAGNPAAFIRNIK